MPDFDPAGEWLEADGRGGFASGVVAGPRTRRYQGLLLTAAHPPTGRFMLVSGCDAWVEAPHGSYFLTTQQYAPGVIPPDQGIVAESFANEPWPRWKFRLPDGTVVVHEIFVARDPATTVLTWRLEIPARVALHIRPFLAGRDYHALQHENPAFRFEPKTRDACLVWHCYDGVPPIVSRSNGEYRHDPHWYRGFQYEAERARGLDCHEDLAAPGVLTFDLSRDEAAWLLSSDESAISALPALRVLRELRDAERKRRAAFATPLHRAADAYLVQRGQGRTIVAGYPWFADWGRDTFIALRGLCLATGRYDDARAILLEWSTAVSEGMLPNRFPDQGESPEYNSVDASLWYIVAVSEFLAAVDAGKTRLKRDERRQLEEAVRQIVSGYERGTRYQIRCDEDGLLAAGEPGVQLTWMDAKVGDWVVTPRIGKPVEVQALWLNALWIARHLDDRWAELFMRGRDTFRARFWSDVRGHLYDVIDCDHRSGPVDPRFRPNQIFAVGGLPITILENGRARKVVDAVERQLWTPLGLRSLSPDDPEYAPHYRGGVRERDGAYHQGTVWPWLIGPFVEAWLRVRGNAPDARRAARERFITPLLEHQNHAGLGHISEVADAAAPHTPGGCPFQAWSLGELLRLIYGVLDETSGSRAASTSTTNVARTLAAAPRKADRRA